MTTTETTIRKTVKSSNIDALEFDRTASTMSVTFKGGRVYRYSNVPEELFTIIADADSVGSTFARTVKARPDLFPYTVVPADTRKAA